MSARRVAAALVVLAAAVGLWLLTEGRADATEPLRLGERITDPANYLLPDGVDAIRAAADKLYADRQIQLWAVYVPTFSGQDPQQWTQATWDASGLGNSDALLAISTSDARGELVYPAAVQGSAKAAVDQLWGAQIYPEIRAGRLGAAPVDLANGLDALPLGGAVSAPQATALADAAGPSPSSPSPWGSLGNLLTRLAVGAAAGLVLAFGLARGRPRGHWAHSKGVGGSLMAAGAVAGLAHWTLPVVVGVVALAVIAAAVWALIRFDLGALVRAAMIGGLGLAGVVIAFLVAPALAPLLLLGLAVWGLVWWLRGRSVDGGNAKLHARVETVLRLNEKSGWSGKIRAGRDKATGLPWRSTTLPLSYHLDESAAVFASLCSEVLGGYWRPSVRGHSVIATLEPADDPLVIPFKTVLRDPRMLGPDAQVSAVPDPSGAKVIALTARFSVARAGELARGEHKNTVKKQFDEQFPPGDDQSWSFDWRLHSNELAIRLTMFPQSVPYIVPTMFMRTVNEAYRHYPQRVFPIGHDVRGNRVDWPIGEQVLVHTLICGGTGLGKSGDMAHLICESVAAGFAVNLIDMKGSRTFTRLAELPNIHLYTRNLHDNVRALSYLRRVMEWRYDETGTIPQPPGSPPKNAPMITFIDESQRLFLDEFSRVFGKGAAEWLVLDTMANSRDAAMHFTLLSQQVTKESIPPRLKRHCKNMHQWGPLDQHEAGVVWRKEYVEAAESVPLVKGRGLVINPKTPDGAPTLVQGIYMPGTSISKPLTPAERQLMDGVLAALAAVPNLYERVVVDPHAGPLRRDEYADAWTAVGPAAMFADQAAVPPECSTWNVPPPPPPSVVDVPGDGTPGGTPGGTTVEHAVEHPMERLLADEAEAYLKAVTGEPDKRAVVIAAYRDGKTVRECADAAGVGLGTAHRWIKAYEREHGNEN